MIILSSSITSFEKHLIAVSNQLILNSLMAYSILKLGLKWMQVSEFISRILQTWCFSGIPHADSLALIKHSKIRHYSSKIQCKVVQTIHDIYLQKVGENKHKIDFVHTEQWTLNWGTNILMLTTQLIGVK